MKWIFVLAVIFAGCENSDRHFGIAGKEVRVPGRNSVITPNVSNLPWTMQDGVKTFHLIAEPVKQEFATGLVVNAWGYTGSTPGPIIEAIEGERVRIVVENRLPEATTIHWHGILVPNS